MKKVGVVGCGAISDIFFDNMIHRFDNLEVVACASKGMASAKAKAEKYGIQSMTLDAMLEDPEIEVIVNLTPPTQHMDIIRRALEHGKHVYTEKVLAPSYEEAKQLQQLADEKGLFLCSAPDTFLGSAIQTAKKAVEEGVIGTVSAGNVAFNRDIGILAEILRFVIQPGAGAGYDMGIYYLTALLSILGPVKSVLGTVRTNRPVRTFRMPMNPDCGKEYTIQNENVMTAILDFHCGTQVTALFNTDSIFPSESTFTLYGTEGLLHLPDPNEFGGQVTLVRSRSQQTEVLPCTFGYSENSRGLGASDMVYALEHGTKPRASKEMAVHALEILDGIVRSSETGTRVMLQSSFEKPVLMDEVAK